MFCQVRSVISDFFKLVQITSASLMIGYFTLG